MVIGVCKVLLHFPDVRSLKGKRQIVRSVIGRVQAKFTVAIAEVDSQDLWQVATIGIACVSNDAQQANEVLSKVVEFIRQSRFDGQLTDYEIELVHAL